jgi:hypothetical protein
MAFRAAMTGHQVFTTLHTNSALGAFPRLLDIGIQPDIMAGNIIGVIAQRLVRVLCAIARRRTALPGGARAARHRGRFERHLYRPVGCKHCANKGYRGAPPIMELLVMDSDHGRTGGPPRHRARTAHRGRAEGLPSLAEEGIARVIDGSTSLAEVVAGGRPDRQAAPVTRPGRRACPPSSTKPSTRPAAGARRAGRGQRSRPRTAAAAHGPRPDHLRAGRPPDLHRRGGSITRSGPHQLLLRHGADGPAPASRSSTACATCATAWTTRVSAKCSRTMTEDMEGRQGAVAMHGRAPDVFDTVFVSLVRAGEQSGRCRRCSRASRLHALAGRTDRRRPSAC